MDKVRVGIIGTGAVANFMTAFMLFRPDFELVCVASRSSQKAEQFAGNYYIPHWTNDYRDLIQYELDMVYIATLPDVHYEIATFFISHGIGVLCEKPLVFEQKKMEMLLSLAKEKQVLLMENLVTAYLPAMKVLDEILSKAGRVKGITLSLGNKHEPDESRLFTDKEYGGVFCDLSCYVLYFLFHIMRRHPDRVESKSVYYNEWIDVDTTLYMNYADGVQAICRMSIMEDMEGCAVIQCENGVIRAENFGRGGKVFFSMDGKEELIYHPSYRFNGFEHVFDEVTKCIGESRWESACLDFEQMKEITRYMIELLPMIKEKK